MSPETVTLEEAVLLLTLPRMLEGADGEEILVANGRYGPFVKRGSETRSLESEEQLLTITVAEAEATPRPAEAAPRPRRRRSRRSRSSAPIPARGKPLVVKDGRFGPYVTDGETNASLRAATTSRS